MAFSSSPSQYTYSDESWTVTAVAKFVMYVSIPLGGNLQRMTNYCDRYGPRCIFVLTVAHDNMALKECLPSMFWILPSMQKATQKLHG